MKMLVISNMYPNKKNPSYGIFVKRFCDELDVLKKKYDLAFMTKSNNKIEKTIKYIFFYITTFLKILIKHYDMIYIHYASHSSLPVIMASKFKKIKIYVNVHGSDVNPENKNKEKFQKYTKKILQLSEKIIVPSEYFYELIVDKYKLDKKKIIVYPSAGISSSEFFELNKKDIENEKSKMNIDFDKKVFAFVGRITRGKGWDIYLNCIRELKLNNKKSVNIIAGDGPDKEKMLTKIKEFGLEKDVIILPLLSQPELLKIYNIIDALIFPTRGESLGLVAIEAMACGTPVIASDISAPKYYIKNDFNGYKFDCENYIEMYNILVKFIDNNYKKNKLSSGAKQTSKNYEREYIRSTLIDILK